jgi:hypothetical protein
MPSISFKIPPKNARFMLVIPVTEEVELRRIGIQGPPGQKVRETPSQSIGWMWYCTPPSYARGIGRTIAV